MKIRNLLALVLYFHSGNIKTSSNPIKYNEKEITILPKENCNNNHDCFRYAVREVNINKLGKDKGLYKNFTKSLFVMLHNSKVENVQELILDFNSTFEDHNLSNYLYPNIEISIKDIYKYFKPRIQKSDLDELEIDSKPLFYCLFILTSCASISNLFDDFLVIYDNSFLKKRTETHKIMYSKVRYEKQNPESLILDDMLLSMMLYGVESLSEVDNYVEYYNKLCEYFFTLSEFYCGLPDVSTKLPNKLYKKIKQDKIYLVEREETDENYCPKDAFDFIKSMTEQELKETQIMIYNLFVYYLDDDKYLENISNNNFLYSSSHHQILVKNIVKKDINSELKYKELNGENINRYGNELISSALLEKHFEGKYYYLNQDIPELTTYKEIQPELIDDCEDFKIFINS